MKYHWIVSILIGVGLMTGCKEEAKAQSWQQQLCKPEAIFPAAEMITPAPAGCEKAYYLKEFQWQAAKEAILCLKQAEAGKRVENKDLLVQARMMGVSYAAVMLSEEEVTTRDALKQRLVKIESAEAAAAWAYLMGMLGEGFRPQALCAAVITQTKTGWHFSNAEIFQNCKPIELATFEVSHAGEVTLVSKEVKKNPNGASTILCID